MAHPHPSPPSQPDRHSRHGRWLAFRRGWDRVPLWLRLITAALALVVVALVVAGVVGTQLLRGYLLTRVDEQLWAASEQVAQGKLPGNRPARGPQLPSQFHVELVNARGLVVWRLSSPLTEHASRPDLPALGQRQAYRRAGEPFTVPSRGGSGHHWRVLVRPLADSGGSLVVATSLAGVDSTVSRLAAIDLVVGAAVCVALALAGYVIVRLSLHPLEEIEITAEAIARGDLSRRVPRRDPRTEVGRLGLALNGMLTQIESAFRARADAAEAARHSEERMRRFVADASHELRTPLTSIRGYAELYRQGAVDASDSRELGQLLSRVEDEATRMGLLVDDLLLLARLDQRRPLDRRQVDLLALAADAVVDGRARDPERSIELVPLGDVPADAPDPVTVPGDEARLRQVVDNLVGNALSHTPAGTPVRVGVGVTERGGHSRGVLEVSDEGPGLGAEQAGRVFERFYRAEESRSRTNGGTGRNAGGAGGAGLGLSIVAALTEAHGGSVELDTGHGQGATFRVLLPRE